jgi:predicted RNase H-like HicB family nuclease
MRYQVILETSPTGVGAYVPDLPGCVAVGASRDEALRLIREGIEFHIEGLRDAGERVPVPQATLELVVVDAA